MPAHAQDAPDRSTLTATGEGQSLMRPDIAVVTLGVVTRADVPTAALAANNAGMNEVIAAIARAGVPDDDVATSGFSIMPVYAQQQPGDDGPAQVTGYEVSNVVTVRVRNFDQSGDLLDKVVTAGANRVDGITFDIADPQAAQDDAMRQAIADARRKAELMAEAAGVRLGRLLRVEASSNGPAPVAAYRRLAAAPPIMGGQQTIAASATLVWEIAPE